MVTIGVVHASSALTGALVPRSTDEPCSSDDTGICGWVLDKTDNESAAKAANWLLGVPLAIIAILLAAWLGRLVRALGDPARDAPDHAPARGIDQPHRRPHRREPGRRRGAGDRDRAPHIARRVDRSRTGGSRRGRDLDRGGVQHRQRARRRPGAVAGRSRHRRGRARLRRPEPGARLHQRAVHPDRGPVRDRRPGRPRRSQWHGRTDLVADNRAARRRRHGVARAQRRGAPRRQPIEVVVDGGRRRRRPRRRRSDGRSRSPPGRRQPSVRTTGLHRRRARAAACARSRVGPRRRRHPASRREIDARPSMGSATRPARGDQAGTRRTRHRPHDAAG